MGAMGFLAAYGFSKNAVLQRFATRRHHLSGTHVMISVVVN